MQLAAEMAVALEPLLPETPIPPPGSTSRPDSSELSGSRTSTIPSPAVLELRLPPSLQPGPASPPVSARNVDPADRHVEHQLSRPRPQPSQEPKVSVGGRRAAPSLHRAGVGGSLPRSEGVARLQRAARHLHRLPPTLSAGQSPEMPRMRPLPPRRDPPGSTLGQTASTNSNSPASTNSDSRPSRCCYVGMGTVASTQLAQSQAPPIQSAPRNVGAQGTAPPSPYENFTSSSLL